MISVSSATITIGADNWSSCRWRCDPHSLAADSACVLLLLLLQVLSCYILQAAALPMLALLLVVGVVFVCNLRLPGVKTKTSLLDFQRSVYCVAQRHRDMSILQYSWDSYQAVPFT